MSRRRASGRARLPAPLGLPAGVLVSAVLAVVAVVAIVVVTLPDDADSPAAAPSAGSDPSASTTPPTQEAVTVPEGPPARACYDLSYAEALAPTSAVTAVDCAQPHTSRTYAVGELDTVVAGHLLAVDSDRVQAQVAAACPAALTDFLGADLTAQRLSVLRPVWFTPSVEESDAGAAWYRCDLVALAGPQRLAPLQGRIAGALATEAGRQTWGLCATAEPGTDGSQRVPCSAEHSWRAVQVVDLGGEAYPGSQAAEQRGQVPCEQAGRAAAEDPLDFEWGYEWPSASQWGAGQTYGLCWVPD